LGFNRSSESESEEMHNRTEELVITGRVKTQLPGFADHVMQGCDIGVAS